MGWLDPVENKGIVNENEASQLKELEPTPTPTAQATPTPTPTPENTWDRDFSGTLKAVEEMNKKYPRDKEL